MDGSGRAGAASVRWVEEAHHSGRSRRSSSTGEESIEVEGSSGVNSAGNEDDVGLVTVAEGCTIGSQEYFDLCSICGFLARLRALRNRDSDSGHATVRGKWNGVDLRGLL